MTQQQSTLNYIQRANKNGIKGIPRASSSGDQGDCTKFTPQTQEVKTDQFKKKKQTRRGSQIMGRQRKNSKEKKRKNPQKEC